MKGKLSFLTKKVLNLGSFRENLKEAFIRFPLSFILVFIISYLVFHLVQDEFLYRMLDNETEEYILRIVFSLVITFFLSISVYLTSENNNLSIVKRNVFQIISIVFWIIFFVSFSGDWDIDYFENIIWVFLTFAWVLSYWFFAPYLKGVLKKEVKQSVYYTYLYRISVIFLVASILSWAVFGLWSIAILTTAELFDFHLFKNDMFVANWAVFSFSLFAPIYALTQIPTRQDYMNNRFNENIFFSFLIKNISVPFICVYFVILYVYSLKVLLTFWDWPKWEVTWMVIGFSIFGYLAYMFSFIFEEINKFIKRFRKYFPYVVIPQLFMLAYAIWIRIAQYDLTINRYFVVIFGVWLLVISLYYIISKKKQLIFIPLTLTLFTIVISIWPWSVYNFPVTRQLTRLKQNLKEAGILSDWWEIIPLNDYKDISPELWVNIYSWIDYLCDFDDCRKIKELFPIIYKDLEIKDKKEWEERKEKDIARYKESIIKYRGDKVELERYKKYLEETLESEYRWMSNGTFLYGLYKTIKVYRNITDYEEKEKNISSTLEFYTDTSVFPLDVSKYSMIYDLSNCRENNYNKCYRIDVENKKLEQIQDYKIQKEIDISDIINKVQNFEISGLSSRVKVYPSRLAFEIDWYKIIFTSIAVQNPEYIGDNKYPGYARWYLLVK